ncbi:phytoene desaturase [Flexibacter flexilis DSM 6793]|uniref:Phytoene desaturase n=1 Tax=Flexibacter flexilis DSM 6793 TaxID=927664 RepID=A0A1I1LW60_9BACT|nr:1-hydroxycarotenoid 3,4-desaturase CrtD [Flexibacter flexilis]SFC74563.1 phytoene desaturase [Flexibacter flexilis DSM 6793]
MNTKKIAIIGAGVAGIAAAIRLRTKGHDVEVFEANDYLGGKLSLLEQDGYRFDAGPSLFTMPELVEELFALAGRNIDDYFHYQRLTEGCRYFYEDGTRIVTPTSAQDFAQEIAKQTGEPAANITSFLKRSANYYGLVGELFLYKSMHKTSTFLNWKAAKAIAQLPALGIFKTMHEANATHFRNPKVVQLFDRFATYNGSSPYQTPALLNMIPHLEHNKGAFLPKGGMYAITESLSRLAKDLGVKFHLKSRVEKILTQQGRTVGLKVNGQELPFEAVVSNMDMVATYRKLLAHEPAPEKLLSQPKSSSALIFYWGINKQFEQLGLHNILFSRDYATEFDHIFKLKTIYADPTVYINITSKHEPSHAPEGAENWFVMINVPNNIGQEWDTLIAQARRDIVRKINRTLKTDIEKLIVTEAMLEPRTIESRTSSVKGALYGNSSNNRYAAFLRHANFSAKIKHLYFCGGSVHPGGGVPLALLSARIMAELLEERER